MDIDVSAAQDAITSIMKAFSDEIDIDDIESVMDRLVVTGNNFPISVSQIAEGMNNASSALAAAGNTFNESVALLTAANTTIQDAARSSTGLRTIAARIRNTKTELDDLGETMTEASYEELVGMLTDFNVALTDVNGEYRSTYAIMSDIAAQWSNMTSMEQAALATALSGTRQQAVFFSIIEQFQEASGAMDTMSNSAGELEKAYSTYMYSAAAHINQFKSAYQELAQNFISSRVASIIVDIGTVLLKLLNSLARINQLIPAISGSIAAIHILNVIKQLQQTNQRMSILADQIVKQKTYTDMLGASVVNLSAQERKRLVDLIHQAAVQREITATEEKDILTKYGLAAADGALTVANKSLALSFKAVLASIGPLGWITIGLSALFEIISLASLFTNDVEDSLENIEQQLEETRNSAKSVADEFRQLKDSASEVIPRFVELASGVNEFGENTRLTDDEYAEFLELNNKIAEMFPELNMGMDDSGNAMLALSYSADTLADSLDDLLKIQRMAANENIAKNLEDALEKTNELEGKYNDEAEKLQSELEDCMEQWDYFQEGIANGIFEIGDDFISFDPSRSLVATFGEVSDILRTIGIEAHGLDETGDGITDKLIIDGGRDIQTAFDIYYKKASQKIQTTKDKITAEWTKNKPIFSAWMNTDALYQDLPDTMQTVADAMLSGLDLSGLNLETEDDVKDFIYDNIINPLYDSGPDVKDAFAKITDWSDQLKTGEISVDEFGKLVTSAFDQLLAAMDPNEVEDFQSKFVAGFATMGIIGDDFDDVVRLLIQNWGKFASMAGNGLNIGNLAETVESTQKAYDLLSAAMQEMRENGGLSADTIKSLADAEENYLDYLYEENGVIKLNAEAWKERSNLAMESDISSIKDNLETLAANNDELERNLELARKAGNREDIAYYSQLLDENTASIEENQTLLNLYVTIYEDITNSLDETDSALSGLSDTLSNLESAYKIVSSAEEEMLDGGGLSASTIQALAKETDNYIDYLYEENGAIKLNIEAWKEYANSDIQSRIDSLEKELAILNETLQYQTVHGFTSALDDTNLKIDETSRELEMLRAIYNLYMETVQEATAAQSEFTKAISNVQELEAGFDLLDKIYTDISDGDTFDWSAILNNDQFAEAFGYLGDVYTEFIETVANSPNDLDACQEAFDRLTTEYLLQSDVLNGVTDSTRDATVAMLEQLGVANAAAIVDQKLAYNNEYLNYTTGVYANLTADELQAMYQECDAGSVLQQVLARVAAEKMLINESCIRTESDIDQLIALANTANATAASIQKLEKVKELAKLAESYEETAEKYKDRTSIYKRNALMAEKTRAQIQDLLAGGIEFDEFDADYFKVTYTGGSEYKKSQESDSKSNSSESSEKEETWFEKQYKLHQHLVAMEQETDADYLTWLNGAYQKAYDEGILELDEYRKYQEEVYKGLQDVFKDHLSDVEHSISMYESLGGDSNKIVSLYNELIADVEKEINAARARGLTDNDDYIQELQDNWVKYREALRDLFKDSLSDIEHEISMRGSFDGENKKIISLYKELIAEVEKEIKSAREQGLTDNDNYIQELQDSWVEYRDAIKDIEDSVKDNAKSALEKLIDLRTDMLKQELDDEKEALDERLSYLKDFYQKQKDLLQDAYDEEKYLEDQSEKRKAVTDIQAQIAQLEYDNSAWAQKRKLELAQELADAQKELSDFERDHALENAQDELDKLYEMQEKELEAQKDLLDQNQNDARSLYVQALEDIKNGSIALYEEMVDWNNLYGDGIEDTIKTAWEDAYKALQDYKDLYGTLYEDVDLQNATGYKDTNGSWENSAIYGSETKSSSSASSAAPTSPPAPATASSASSSTATSASSASSQMPQIGSKVTVKKSATHFGSGSSYKKMASFVPGGEYTVYQTKGSEILIGRDGVYTGWVKKSDIVGYALGTSKASYGLHKIDEDGLETIFESSDGTRYKMFSGGEKVLNAKASDFLYKFANSGATVLEKFLNNAIGAGSYNGIRPNTYNNAIQMGDIVIQGSADQRTVSEIRRAQRDGVSFLLKEFTRLQK